MKSIVIYFSRADENYSVGFVEKGNTEVIAEYIKEMTGADLFKVEPTIAYSKDYNTCIEEAKQRQESSNAPIISSIPDISNYDTIYIGSPIYWNRMPAELETALKEVDFSGKTIRVFTTHEGSGLGNVVNDIKRICVGANVLDNSLEVQGSMVNFSKDKVKNWIK